MTTIPPRYADLLERPLFGHLGTVRPDGTPQVTPMWFTYDGELLYFTTATNRAKYAQMRANPNVALSVNDAAIASSSRSSAAGSSASTRSTSASAPA